MILIFLALKLWGKNGAEHGQVRNGIIKDIFGFIHKNGFQLPLDQLISVNQFVLVHDNDP